MDEYEIIGLRQIIDEIDREVILDRQPKLSVLRELIKYVDDIDLEEIIEQSEKYDDYKSRMYDIYDNLDRFSEGIDILESLKDNLTKFMKAMEILNIDHNIDIDAFNSALEKISVAYNNIEQNSGD